jgi:hypothetical protein
MCLWKSHVTLTHDRRFKRPTSSMSCNNGGEEEIMFNLVGNFFNFMESHVQKIMNTKLQKLQYILGLLCME